MIDLCQKLSTSPGVYIFKDKNNKILYIGKAANLKRRVSSYFLRPQDARVQKMVSEIKNIDYQKTDTAIEALILEANLIKQHQPPFNIKEKDDKSFLYVEITDETWPRVLLVRGTTKPAGERIGPFISASQIRQALKILRKIFPWNTHPLNYKNLGRPCFDYEIGLCPGTCIGAISRRNYLKNIKNLKIFFKSPSKLGEASKKEIIIKRLTKEMKLASVKTNFEQAEKLRRQIFALQHIQDIALIAKNAVPHSAGRLEGYDISNISGDSAVGSMAVFINGEPAKNEYRKFKIQTIKKADDIGMLKEILHRRFKNDWPASARGESTRGWPLPDLILIDGGVGQVNATNQILSEFGLKITVVGLAKGPTRKADKIIGRIPSFTNKNILIQLRDEAHRFAINYHKKLRDKKFLEE